jgi:hypothetical protein
MDYEGAAAGGKIHDLERELLLIECQEAHVEGNDRVAIAAKAVKTLKQTSDSPFEVYAAAALACYNAGIDTRDQQHFTNAVTIGRQIIARFDSPAERAEGHHYAGIALPRAESAAQRKHWETALQLLESAEESEYVVRLKAKIANSLAEQLSSGSDIERSMAKRLFETSIELKERPEIADEAGLAISHGGLGRLALFATKPDHVAARKHFAENLRLSEKLGSATGQTKMHSLLAAVDVAEKQLVNAKQHYRAAFRLAPEQVDKIFSLSGLIVVHSLLGQSEEADRNGVLLRELIESRLAKLSDADRNANPVTAIPGISQANLTQALERSKASAAADWHRWLSELLDNNQVLPPTG